MGSYNWALQNFNIRPSSTWKAVFVFMMRYMGSQWEGGQMLLGNKGIKTGYFIVTLIIVAGFSVIYGMGCGGGGGGGGGSAVPTECLDAVDNDLDGWVDADDPDCGSGLPESGVGSTQCNDGIDNDTNGDIDSADPDCADALDDNETGGATIVGAAGGTVASDDGVVSVVIPAGALFEDTAIEVTSLTTTPPGGIGTAYLFKPEGLSFDIPVTIAIDYDELDIPDGLAESGITLGTFVNGHQWRYMMGGSVDTSANTVTGTTSSFSTYGLMIRPFEAALDGSQVVPSTASSATGTALFSIDSDNNILAYNISISALEGTQTSAAIHGPANAGANAPAVHTLVSGSPKVGVWKYDESLEDELLSGEMYVSISTSLYPSGEVRGQIEPSAASMMPSDVTVRIHQWNDLSGSGPVTGISGDVYDVVINITAPDMTPIAAAADLSAGNIVESVSVPRGGARLFEALAYSVGDTLLYNAYTYADVFDAANIVTLSMIGTTDSTPPTFGGLAAVQKSSGDAVTLSWTAGMDDTASSLELVYLVYASKSSGGQSFTSPGFTTDPGETVYTINGLAMGTTYHFVVRAMDPAGNIDTNVVEVSASTYSSGAGLYVDVNSGTDGPSCGTSSDPCKTITYALTLTPGDEAIYIAKGIYDNTAGESFPLTLKTGTSLLGDLVFYQVFPTTSGNVLRGTLMPASVIRPAVAYTDSVIVGEDGAYISGILMDLRPSINNGLVAVDGSGKSIFMNWSALYGPADPAIYRNGVRIGAGSKVKHSLITDFKGMAVYGYEGYVTISHNVLKNNEHGVSVTDSHIYRNSIKNNLFGVSCGPDTLVFSNYISGNYRGIDQPGGGTKIESNWIVNNESHGIWIIGNDEAADTVIVKGNHIRNNQIGIEIKGRRKAVINGNDLICNDIVNFLTIASYADTTVETDITYNRWDHNPPTITTWEETGGCPDGDICFNEVYYGTRPPVYLPTNGTENCGSIAIAPIL